MSNKKFICVWGEGYVEPHQDAAVRHDTIEAFTEEEGYDIDHVKSVAELKIGESVNLIENGAYHSVVRIL